MKLAGSAKHFILAFVFALVGYVICYQFIESRRTRNGPWQITFAAAPGNTPLLVINQHRLGITNVQLSFPGATLTPTNVPATLSFEKPKAVPYDLPFGKCIFIDSTFLPGTLTLQMFQHEVELLPRVLVIDRQEHPWRSETAISVPRGRTAPPNPKP